MKNKLLGYVSGFALLFVLVGMSYAAWSPFTYVWPYNSLFQGPMASTASIASGMVTDVGVAAGTVTLDLSAGNTHRVLMPAGNTTVAFSNPWVGEVVHIGIQQDGTGSRTVTWPSNIKWTGGSAPTLTTTASKTDFFTLVYDANGNWYETAAELNE